MSEIWKEIDGFNGLYLVSNYGDIKSTNYRNTNNEHLLSKTLSGNGYFTVSLKKDNRYKPFLVHRLIACAFIDNPNNYPEVNHIDEDKLNNNVNNLEWCDKKYNMNYGTRNERASKSMLIFHNEHKDIYYRHKEGVYRYDKSGNLIDYFETIEDAVNNTRISRIGIIKCCNKKSKTSGGFIWRYSNDTSVIVPVKNNLSSGFPILQCLSDGQIINKYISIREASRQTGIDATSISRCSKGKQKNAGGYVWKKC